MDSHQENECQDGKYLPHTEYLFKISNWQIMVVQLVTFDILCLLPWYKTVDPQFRHHSQHNSTQHYLPSWPTMTPSQCCTFPSSTVALQCGGGSVEIRLSSCNNLFTGPTNFISDCNNMSNRQNRTQLYYGQWAVRHTICCKTSYEECPSLSANAIRSSHYVSCSEPMSVSTEFCKQLYTFQNSSCEEIILWKWAHVRPKCIALLTDRNWTKYCWVLVSKSCSMAGMH